MKLYLSLVEMGEGKYLRGVWLGTLSMQGGREPQAEPGPAGTDLTCEACRDVP